MDRLKRVGVSLLASLAGMLVLWVALFFFAPKTAALVYLYPGIVLFSVLGETISSKVLYLLFPSGGLDATAGFATLFAAAFWWFLGTVGIYLMLLARSRRKK
jgi:hypothetical protein